MSTEETEMRVPLKKVGRRLRLLREAVGLTQAEFGGRLRPPVSGAHISRWEVGNREIPVSRLYDWADVFRIGAAYFLGGLMEGDTEEAFAERVAENVKAGERVDAESKRTGVPLSELIMTRRKVQDEEDERPVPPGLKALIEGGHIVKASEFKELVDIADPLENSGGARAAWQWTPDEWFRVLAEERRARDAEAKVRQGADEMQRARAARVS